MKSLGTVLPRDGSCPEAGRRRSQQRGLWVRDLINAVKSVSSKDGSKPEFHISSKREQTFSPKAFEHDTSVSLSRCNQFTSWS